MVYLYYYYDKKQLLWINWDLGGGGGLQTRLMAATSAQQYKHNGHWRLMGALTEELVSTLFHGSVRRATRGGSSPKGRNRGPYGGVEIRNLERQMELVWSTVIGLPMGTVLISSSGNPSS